MSAGISVGEVLALSAARHPDKTALVFGDRRFSYGELNALADRFANALLGIGVKRGVKVAILSRNSPEFVVVHFAVAKAGASFLPLNYLFSVSELSYVIAHSDAEVLFFSQEFAEKVEALRPAVGEVRHFISLSGRSTWAALDYDTLLAAAASSAPRVAVHEDDHYTLMYTSGTTGRPKGVVSSHRSRVQVALQGVIDYRMRHEEVCLLSLPLFHMGGLNTCFVSNMLSGATVVLLPKFDPGELMRAVARHRCTFLFLAPSPIYSIVESPELGGADLSSVRWIMYGGAPMPREIFAKAADRLPGVRFIQGYGSTEAGQLTVVGPEHHPERSGTIGRPCVLASVRLVDEAGREVADGEVGEIATRGPNVMTGYYKAPEDTAVAMAGGWLHTGDLARRDRDGFLTLVDRKKDMIISGSENIYPKEVEDVLYSHPAVQDAAVFGIPDEKWGESVCAAIVLNPGAKASEEELIEFCRARLASYKKPRSVKFLDAMPRTSIGKIAKAELRDPYWRGLGRRI